MLACGAIDTGSIPVGDICFYYNDATLDAPPCDSPRELKYHYPNVAATWPLPKRWGGWIGSIPGLQEVVLELETIDVKRGQLEERVQAALAWKFPLAENGGSLVHDGKEPIDSTWLGTSRMSPGQQYDNSEDSEEGEETDEEEYSDDYDHSDEEGSESDGGSGAIIEADEEINLQEPDIPVLVPEEAQVVADAHLQESHTDVEGSRLSALGEESTEAPQQLDVGQGQDVSSPGELDRDDLDYPLDLKLHVRKLRFINESRLP
ncbi:hypothetical protein DFH09DRAFT_1112282 [Mycena vulgaris]|nr:hypothetical protein DFH09DRAFT_1112282 [Mycena vulgaris]